MRSRRAQSSTAVAAEEPPDSPASKLQFSEALTWRAGSKITVAELLRRLQSLFRELKDIDQAEAARQSIVPAASELASQQLLAHKDAGARAWTACCLVEVFRLCAPTAPYSGTQLKDIFGLFIKSIIPALSDPLNSYSTQHLHVLQSLSQVKSILVVLDIPSSTSLIVELFNTCFNVLSNPGNELSKNVEFNMTGLLQCLVDECESLPHEVIETIMMQFMRADPRVSAARLQSKKPTEAPTSDHSQSTLQFKQLPPAYNLAKNICNTAVDRMARYTSQYFSSVIMDASELGRREKNNRRSRGRASFDANESDDEHGTGEEDFKELEKAHLLLRELWRSCPGVLHNVVPQVEAEMSAENVQLRMLATEAIGDLCSGVGSAGPSFPPHSDPAAYPYLSLTFPDRDSPASNGAAVASSTQSFPQTHPSAYQSFLSRRNDKSPLIRSVWTLCVGRIISSSAGGSGLEAQEEERLIRQLSQMLVDGDDKVRLAAVQALAKFSFKDFVSKLGPSRDASTSETLMKNLTDRIKDRKQPVSAEATHLLGRLWGAAVGELLAGNDPVKKLFGQIPSKIFEAVYVNDRELNCTVDKVLFECLMPLSFPALKKKDKQQPAPASRQRAQAKTGSQEDQPDTDADHIRTERLLLLVRDLEPRSKQAFLAWMARPMQMAQYLNLFLKRCEEYNGGVMEGNKSEIMDHLTRLIEYLSNTLPDSSRVGDDLWKFAKIHDRRSYSLIRFCLATDSDFRKIFKSFKELSRRMEGLQGASVTTFETLKPLLYRCSNLFYNKSNVHPIMEFSQSDANGLGAAAQDLLKEISEKSPSVFKAHAEELCRGLETHAPSPGRSNDAGVLNEIRACATFARKFPADMPRDRKFLQSITQYALYGTPPSTAKYAVSLLLSCADKKETQAKNVLRQCIKDFEYGSAHFLAKLASLSQLVLLAPAEVEESNDTIVDITIDRILLQVRTKHAQDLPEWQDEPDEETEAKMWALKILVDRIRAYSEVDAVKEISEPVYRLLNKLIANNGELSKDKSSPKPQRARLRLQAALLHLKLCTNKEFDSLLTAEHFNNLATVAQDPLYQVRHAFLNKLKKYLGQDRIQPRFYAIVFLLAFEPSEKLKQETVTWVRARAIAFRRSRKLVLEQTFARFLSLLAHHPDFGRSAEDLVDFAPYIIFYLQAIATEENLSLIYHIAQRLKSVQDRIDPQTSDNLYCLSDLAQAIIRQYEEARNWSMQAYAGKFQPPSGIFSPLPSHEIAQEIASKQYLPDGVTDQLEQLMKENIRARKRRSDSRTEQPAKRRSTVAAKDSTSTTNQSKLAVRPAKKAPTAAGKKRQQPLTKDKANAAASERRRSTRTSTSKKSYAESQDSEDDAEGGGARSDMEESDG